jgi:hypothetical protein
VVIGDRLEAFHEADTSEFLKWQHEPWTVCCRSGNQPRRLGHARPPSPATMLEQTAEVEK